MSGWRDAPVVDDAPAWMSAPEVERRKEPRAPTSLGERFVTGLMDPIIGAGQIADRYLVNPIRQRISPGATSMEDVVRQRDAEYVAPEGMDWARMGGNIANPLSWAGGGAGVGRAAAAGAMQAALTPTAADSQDFMTEKVKQMAVGGAAGGTLAKVLPRVIRPVKPSAEGEALLAQGVRVTPGQAAGGIANTIEQKLTSWPLVGDTIQTARRRALEDVQEKAVERATGIRGIKTIEDANAAVNALYSEAVPHIKPNPEGLFGAAEALNTAVRNPELTPQHVKTLQGIFDRNFANYSELSGEGLKKLDSELGATIRKYTIGPSVSPADKTLGESLRSIQQAMREGWEQGMRPEAAAKLRQANRAFRALIPINKAASQRADDLATPRALQKAMARQAGRDVTRMQADPLLDPAVKALGSTVPDSGTAGRLLLPGLGASVAMPVASVAAWAGAKAALSRPGVKALTGNTAVQRKLGKMTPAARKAIIAAIRANEAGGGGGGGGGDGGAIDSAFD